MPTNTLDKIRHSLSCVAVLFGLLGIFVFASFSPSYAWLYLGGLAAPFIYSIVFVYAIAAWSIYSKYYPFLSLGRLSFVECFFPALALVCLTVLYNAFSGPEPWMAELSRQFFLHKFLNTLAMCFLAPVAEEIIFRGFFIKQQYRLGSALKSFRYYYYLTRFCIYAYTISLCGDFCLSVCFFIDIMRCSNEKSWANDTDNTSYFK